MTPIGYKKVNGITVFKYNLREFIEWYKLGKEEGNVGSILHSREGSMFRFLLFGTIENPRREPIWFTKIHYDLFDGPLPTDDEILVPPKPMFSKDNMRIMFVDLSKRDKTIKSQQRRKDGWTLR